MSSVARRVVLVGLAGAWLAGCTKDPMEYPGQRDSMEYPVQAVKRGVDDRHWVVFYLVGGWDVDPARNVKCVVTSTTTTVTVRVFDPDAVEPTENQAGGINHEESVEIVLDQELGSRRFVYKASDTPVVVRT